MESFENIDKFLADNSNFIYKSGEIGMGRKGVGIVDSRNSCYLGFTHRDHRTFETIAEHNVAGEESPSNAYHKDTFLFVMTGENDQTEERCKKDLDIWLGHIIESGYVLRDFTEQNTIGALMNGGSQRVTVLCDKE